MASFSSANGFVLQTRLPFRHSPWSLIKAWLPTVVWIGVICFESTSIFTSEHTQHWLYVCLNFVSPKLATHVDIVNAVGRKVGHFTGYGVLSGLSFFGWTELLAYLQESRLIRLGRIVEVPRRWHLRAAVLGVLVTFAVACLDEFHQTFIPGRTGVFHDVILDTMGGVFAQVLILLFWRGRPDKGKVERVKGNVMPRAGELASS